MKTIRIGGVPEHFNIPWHNAIDRGWFSDEGINLQWTDQPGGTGAMNKALREGELDMALVLTEGIVADIIKGNPSAILQMYVKSPLIWGIHVLHEALFNRTEDLKGQRFCISRNGSGSHIMAYVNARNMGWDVKTDLQFETTGNFDGAVEAMKANKSDAILWEKFTTKPYVDKGILKCIGECITPWPCFMLVARNEFIEEESESIKTVMRIINQSSVDFMNDDKAVEVVSERHDLSLGDAFTWFYQTEWCDHNYISGRMLENVMQTLKAVGVIDEIVQADKLISPLTILS